MDCDPEGTGLGGTTLREFNVHERELGRQLMASPVEATMILCEHAVVDPGSGKIHMLGAGWSVTTSPISAQAVAIMVSVPWDRANEKIHLTLSLLDPDGRAIHVGPPGSGTDIRQEFHIEVGRPAGIPTAVRSMLPWR